MGGGGQSLQMFTIRSQHVVRCVSFIRGLPCIGISLCVLLTHIPPVCMSTFPKAGLRGWKSFSPCGLCLHGQQRSTTSKSCHRRLAESGKRREGPPNATERYEASVGWPGNLDSSELNEQGGVKRFGIKKKKKLWRKLSRGCKEVVTPRPSYVNGTEGPSLPGSD